MPEKSKLHYKKKEFYRRKLPHFQNKGALFFVTFNTKSALKVKCKEKLKKQFFERKKLLLRNRKSDKEELDKEYRRYFGNYDDYLHKYGKNHWLKNEDCAKITAEALHFWDDKRIELYAFCIMSNHVHAVFRVFEKDENGKEIFLQDITESIKKFSAKECNKILNRSGQFWQNESYDRLIRNRGELFRIISYVLDNPVKAGLCENRKDWKFSYVKDDYNEFM